MAASSKASAAEAAPRREDAVLDTAPGPAEGRGGSEVVCEIGESATGVPRRPFEGVTDAKVELCSAQTRQPVV